MDSSSFLLSCSKRSVLNNGQLEFIFSNCFERSVLNNGQFEFTFIFQKASSPASSENEMSLNPSHHYQISFLALSEHGISMFIPRFVSFPALSEHGISSVIPRLSDDEMSKVSSLVCLVQRCHQSKCLFLQTIGSQIHFKFPNTTINTVVNDHYSPVKLQYPLVESGPFLQRIWISFCSSSFKTNHLHHPTFIITSQSIHNILSQKWCTYI